MSNEIISFVEESLKKSREQDNAIEAMLLEMKNIKEETASMKDEVKDDVKDVRNMVVEVRNRVHLEEADANKIKSIVAKKSHEIAKQKYGDSKEYGAEYRELLGYARRRVYKKLKNRFNVTKYTAIRHVDREAAKDYAESIVLDNSFLMDYEQWKYQRARKREREIKKLEELN